MVIKEIAHVNIVVSEMEVSKKFYSELLGLEVVLDKEIQSTNFCKGVGLKEVKARVVMLKLKDENTLLELFQYYNPESKPLGDFLPNAVPASHIAFRVEGIQDEYKRIKQNGAQFISEPQELADGVFFCYFRDPDGALLELIEFPQ